jgi:hypothetical protein
MKSSAMPAEMRAKFLKLAGLLAGIGVFVLVITLSGSNAAVERRKELEKASVCEAFRLAEGLFLLHCRVKPDKVERGQFEAALLGAASEQFPQIKTAEVLIRSHDEGGYTLIVSGKEVAAAADAAAHH